MPVSLRYRVVNFVCWVLALIWHLPLLDLVILSLEVSILPYLYQIYWLIGCLLTCPHHLYPLRILAYPAHFVQEHINWVFVFFYFFHYYYSQSRFTLMLLLFSSYFNSPLPRFRQLAKLVWIKTFSVVFL